jgi:hypothetical protein
MYEIIEVLKSLTFVEVDFVRFHKLFAYMNGLFVYLSFY